MQIHAHSLTPTERVPYMHLGYTAATGIQESITVPFFCLLMGIYLIANFWRKAKRAVLAACLVLLVAGVYAVHTGIKANRHAVSRGRVRLLMNRITQHHAAGDPIPANTAAMQREWQLDDDLVHDRWGQMLCVQVQPTKDGTAYCVQSAGPDRRFDTKDDLKHHIELPPPAGK